MYQTHPAEQSAIVFGLIAELDAYEQSLRRVTTAETVSLSEAGPFQKMGACASSVPQLTGAWAEVVISRAEFTQELWLSQFSPLHDEGAKLARMRHARALARLQAQACSLIRRKH